MFLFKLNEEEKKAFLQLAHYMARVDGEFPEEEQAVIKMYAHEMGIKDEGFKEHEFNLDNILNIFKSKKSKNIVLLEIMALVYADGRVDDKEEELLQYMCIKFGITRKTAKIYEEWIKAILALYKQGELFINV
jgi:tellurite resistance protein